MAAKPVTVLGVGVEGRAGLSQAANEAIRGADELWGSERLLAMWPDFERKKVPLGKQLMAALQQLIERPADHHIVILASGDPNFYGIAASVLKILPAEEVVIYPQASFLQSAFARICVPWHDAALTSAHARPIGEIIGLARRFPKLGILTDPLQNPAWIAGKLLTAGIPDCRAVVIENLGSAQESIMDTRLRELPSQRFAPLNVLLLIHDAGWKPAPVGVPRPDSAYRHKNGLMTKSDVRTISVGRLGICETDVIWDIGAGSGAMSIEMAEIAWRGKVLAIERNAECLACLEENIQRFGVTNIEVVPGEAPQALKGLPAPDAVFIGGSGGRLMDIFLQVKESAPAGCRIAANFTLLENLISALSWMQAHGCEPILTEASFSYGVLMSGSTRLAPSNPVFILSGSLPKRESE